MWSYVVLPVARLLLDPRQCREPPAKMSRNEGKGRKIFGHEKKHDETEKI